MIEQQIAAIRVRLEKMNEEAHLCLDECEEALRECNSAYEVLVKVKRGLLSLLRGEGESPDKLA